MGGQGCLDKLGLAADSIDEFGTCPIVVILIDRGDDLAVL